MAIRDTLLANLSTSLSSTNVSITNELPFSAAGVPLYEKNMKKFYLDVDNTDIREMFLTLDNNDVFEREVTLTGYLSVDAKNQPTDIETVVNTVINSRLSVADCFVRECAVTDEILDDRINYTFEFRFLTI